MGNNFKENNTNDFEPVEILSIWRNPNKTYLRMEFLFSITNRKVPSWDL